MLKENLILQTKLVPPQIKGKTLRRERLLNLLKENLNKKLILICADAGYGKTTLLAQMLSEIPVQNTTYYSLNQSDSDPNNFFNYLIFGLKRCYPKFGQRTKNILDESPNFNLNAERILTTFINESLPLKNHIIILDDFHAIKKAGWIKSSLEYLLTYLPSNTHFIISTREMPDFNLSRLLAKQDLFTITREDLKFTDEEIDQLLTEILSIEISDEQFKRLIDVSQGWITGIQLILPQCTDEKKIKEALNGYLTSNLSLFEYFANEIFINEDRQIQKFLISISILDEIYPEYCDAIMNTASSRHILREIEKRNIFIFSIGREKNHFRFHPLFKKFLLHRLKEILKSSEITFLYRRVGKFCEQSRRIEEAIEYYIRGAKYKQAARLIERYAEQIISKGELISFQDWLSRIPVSLFTNRPWLYYYKAFLLDRVENQLEEVLNIYKKTRRLFERGKNKKGLAKTHLEMATILCRRRTIKEAKRELRKAEKYCSTSNLHFRSMIYNIKGMIAEYSGEYRKAKKYLLEMLNLSGDAKSSSLLMLIHCNLGVLYTREGDYDMAEREHEEAFKILHKKGSCPGIGLLYANAAHNKIQKEKLDEAEILLKEGLDICYKYNDTFSLINIEHIWGDLYLARGDFKRALEYYNQTLALSIEKGEDQIRKDTIESIIQLSIKEKKLDRAKEYFTLLCGGVLKKKDIYLHPSWAMLESEFKIAEGKNESAIKSLKNLLSVLRKRQNHFLNFKANLYLSMLYESSGKRYLQYLNVALDESQKFDYERSILQNDHFLLFLKREVEKGKGNDYINRILLQAGVRPIVPKRSELHKIRVKFFGIPQVISDGKLVGNWTSEKAKKLFFFFILNRERRITKDEIIGIFWPDLTINKGGQNFWTNLHYIRKALMSRKRKKILKEIILYHSKTYFIDPQLDIISDVKEFENLVGELKIRKAIGKHLAADGLLKKIISLYKNGFCVGWFEPWVEDKRAVYENIYLKAILWAAEESFLKHNFDECLEYCKEVISVDKYNEDIHRLLIRSLLKLGRKYEAASHYDNLVRVFDNLKINFSFDTLKLKQELFG